MVREKCANRIDGVSTLRHREGLLLLRPQFGFCPPAAALSVGSLPGLGLRLPLLFLFVGSPLGLGVQPPCFLLGLLPGSGLFHSPALFRRHPWLIQRF